MVGDAVSSLKVNDVTCQKEDPAVLLSTVLSSESRVWNGKLEKEMGGAGKKIERRHRDVADLRDQEDDARLASGPGMHLQNISAWK